MLDLRSQLGNWPKIDLHRHLEGSLRLETLSEIARDYGIDSPEYGVEAIRPRVQVTEEPYSQRRFLSKFEALRHFFRTQELIERVTCEAVADAAQDNVRYLELRFTPSALAKERGFTLEQVTQWVVRAARRAETAHEIRVNLIMSMNRHEPLSTGKRTMELAMRSRGSVVGLDLAGDEALYSARPFASLFQEAKEAGLGITIHAGEWMGPENIIESVEHLNADRIGHGVRAVEDSDAVRLLRERNIALEICPTSNLQSGVVRSPRTHPMSELLRLGLPITINTDDPSVSGITLTDEYVLAVKELGLTLADLRRTILSAARAAFLPVEERAELVDWFEQALAAS
jgi:adenosine deaminase